MLRLKYKLILLVVLLVGCRAANRAAITFDEGRLSSFSGNTILCFDFRSRDPVGGLILRITSTPTSGRRDILLPFPAHEIQPNRSLLLTSGTYDRFAIVSAAFGTPSLHGSSVAFVPEMQPLDLTNPQLEGLDPGAYFQENGLEYWFVFIDSSPTIQTEILRDFPGSAPETFDAIAVAIPVAAEGREVRKGFTIYPPPSVRLKNFLLFTKPARPAVQRIELRYAVPPTAAQVAASSNGLKLLLVLIVPVVTLIFLDPDDIQRPRLRLIAIWGGLSLQALIVAVVVWAALQVKTPLDAWIDFGISALGVACEVVVILVKSKAGRDAPTA
jgi:hypothetical protein